MSVSVRTGTRVPAYGPTLGMVGQFGLLAVLSWGAGLGPAGWLAGAGYALVVCAALTRGLYRAGMRTLGAANQVTLARAALVGGVAALVADAAGRPPRTAVLIVIAALALLLDGVDGQVARRTGTTSALGARFDMEVDAFLILVLSVFAAGSLGGWVLTIGVMRYAFVAASWPLPWLRRPLPYRFSRKVVAAVQGILLVLASAGVMPRPLALGAAGLALAALTWSFGRDVGWLWRSARRREPARAPRRTPRPVPPVAR